MSILSSELQLFKSAVVNDTSTNGGRISNNQIISGTLANCFDHVLPEERVSGSNKIRKCFYLVANDDDLILYAAKLFLDAPTPGEDWVTMFAGTMRDTVADHSSPRRYGCAFLQANANAGASTVILEVEDSSIAAIFQNGDTIVITDKLTPTALAGNREVHTINGAPVVVGSQVTITLTATLANAYTTAANARVSSVIVAGDLAGTVSNWAETGTGTYDEVTYPVLTDNIGTMEQTWTVTFSDASTFSVVGDTIGSVGSGVIGSNFAPVNPDNSKPYFTLRAAGHGGTHTAGDTLVFQTHPPAYGFYLNRVLPAGAAAESGNRITPVILGATA